MGLDASIYKIKTKVNNYEEYKNLRKIKSRKLNKVDFYKWELSVFYTDEWLIHYFINIIHHSSKTNYNNGESMLITKQDLQFLIKKLQRKLKTYKGLKELDRIEYVEYTYPKEVLKFYSRKWWRKEVLKPLQKILDGTNFENETLFYNVSY